MSHRGNLSLAGNRGRVALFAGIILVVVAAAIAGSLALLRRQPSGPREAAEAWLRATKAGDEPAVRELTCAAAASGVDLDEERSRSVSWSVTADTTTADAATVTAEVTYTVEGFLQHDTWTVSLVRESDAWKFCGLQTTLTDPDTPRTALVDWMAAALANDIATVHSLTCAAEADGITAGEIAAAEQGGLDYEISEVAKVDETTAQVAFTVTVQRNGGPVSFDERWQFVQEDDAWKACGPARS